MGFLGFSSAAEVYVYATCVLLGISVMMPLQAITSAPRYMVDYYKYVTRNPDAEPNSTVLWANILTFYNVASVVAQIIVGPTVLLPCTRRLSLTLRFILALTFMMVEVLVVVVMPAGGVSQTSATIAFFIVTVGAGAGKSYLEATCYAMVSSMPPKFMSAVMFGCGFSGVVASTLQCIIKASLPDTYESALTQSYIYFSLALGIMATALCMALCLRYNRFAQRYVGEFRNLKSAPPPGEADAAAAEPEAIENEPATGGNEVFEGDVVLEDKATQAEGTMEKKASGEEGEEDEEVRELSTEVEEVEESRARFTDQHLTTAQQLQHTRVKPIIKLIYPMQIACFCIFFVSLFIFPSLIVPIDRTDKWFATIAILIYNCGDATGRLSSSIKKIWPSRRVLIIVSLCRFVYLPLIFLCIYKYIPGHAPPYVILGTLGLTKGFFGATSMVFGPNTPGLKSEGQRVMAGQLMGISLLAGASVSALLALLVVLFLP